MTEDTPGNVVKLAEQFDKAKRVKGRKKRPEAPDFVPPEPLHTLPDDCPVVPLGRQGRVFYFLNSLGELVEYKDSELGRLGIISLFGGEQYLLQRWPGYNAKGVPTGDFDHGAIAPILIEACTARGVWDPVNFVRGPGTWSEDDGQLVMHCGEFLWVGEQRLFTGVRGRYLYPKAAPLAEPRFDGDPGGALLARLESWNWMRVDIDPRLVLGWLCAALIGQAQPWRPALWITGGRGRGKSTLQKLINWVLTDEAIVQLEDTSGPAIYRTIGDSALPVALDEFEAQSDNQRAEGVLKLARIAASGGTVARVGGDGKVQRFKLRNCFLFSSILIPPLNAANRSRLAICELLPLSSDHGAEEGPEAVFDPVNAAKRDPILGAKEDWRAIGRMLRGRVIQHWARYHQTFQTYRHALLRAGHDTRAAEQFGSLGAAYDVAMYDALDAAAAKEWAAMLPSRTLAETSGYESEPVACLKHLLRAPLDLIRGGAKETVAHYLRVARKEAEDGIVMANDPGDARRVLEKIGVRVWRDRRELALWWVGVSATHRALNEIFAGTHWKGMAGATGTWAQALSSLPGADGRRRLRVDGDRDYLVPIPWQTVFPPYDAHDDDDERALIADADQAAEVRKGRQT